MKSFVRRSRAIWAVVIVAIIAQATEFAGQERKLARLLHPGTFFNDQIDEDAKGEWLALVQYGSRAELEPREVALRQSPDKDDPSLDEVEILVPGLEQEPHAVFLVRGITAVGPGVVREATIECGSCALPAPDLAAGRQVHLSLGGQEYVLEVNPLDKTQPLDRTSTVTLRSGDKRQVLYRLPEEPDEPAWPILWAGDLDGDGRIDLYMDLSWKYSVSRRVLFLSSAASDPNLVGEAAVFETTGA